MKSTSKIAVVISLVFGLAACDNMSRDTGTASAPAASAVSTPAAASQASAPVEAKAELDLNNFDITEHLGDKELGFKVAQLCKAELDLSTGEYKSKACNEIFNDLNSPCNLDSTSHNPFCDAINEDTEEVMREHFVDQEMKRANSSAEVLNHPTATEAQGIVLAEKCYNAGFATSECRTAVRQCANDVAIGKDDKCRGMDAFLQSKATGLLQVNVALPKEEPKPVAPARAESKPWPNGLEPTRSNANKCANDQLNPEACNVIFQICQNKRDSRSKHQGCRAFLDAAEH